jgi:DNA polymerase type B, organellar and viral
MTRIVGINGEGVTVREDGKVLAEAHNKKGLSHEACVKLLLSLPKDALCFAFSTRYHATKIFEGIKDPFDIFMIFHPKVRRQRGQKSRGQKSTPLHRVGPYGFTADRSGFTVAEGRTMRKDRAEARWARCTRVWDAAGFTHQTLTESLQAFRLHGDTLKALSIAKLMRRVLDTLNSEGIDLKGQYRGAGSMAGSLMRQHNVRAYRGPSQSELAEKHPELAHAIMAAYFGGREEIVVQGKVKGPLWEYDLSAAYPRAMVNLPCLACGHWRRITQGTHEINEAAAALVHFRVKEAWRLAWAPLPCRTEDGPVWGSNFEGWAWWLEVEAAMRHWPHLVQVLDGWAYHTSCKHKPFVWLSQTYQQRCNLEVGGRDLGGAQLLKAGMVAVYGKTSQRFESPVQSYVWAGMTTALVRASLLRLLGAYGRDIVSVATDAVLSREGISLPDTWKIERHAQGANLIAPGVFEKMSGTEKVFASARDHVVAMIRCTHCGLMWDLKHGFACPTCSMIGGVPRAAKLEQYGRWVKQKREKLGGPHPMRDEGPQGQLVVRNLGGAISLPYEP